MRARSLPLSGCTVATTRVGDGVSWCESCRRHVTDLSAMTEAEARAWLRDGSSGRRCVSYRIDERDRIVFAPSRAAILLGPWLALLVACAGHLDTRVDADPWACRDAHGYEIGCPTRDVDWSLVPDELVAPKRAPEPADARATDASSDPHAGSGGIDGIVGASPLGPDAELDAFTDRVALPDVNRSTRRRVATGSTGAKMAQGIMIVRDVSIVVSRSAATFGWPSSIDDPPTQAEALARAEARRAARRAARARRDR